MSDSFFSSYLEYTDNSEVPKCFHRWSAIAGIGALLERSIYTTFNDSRIFPNMYQMLIGVSATRKTTAIIKMKKLMLRAGYTTFAGDITSKEKFLSDLEESAGNTSGSGGGIDSILEANLFGTGTQLNENDYRPVSIFADEANDFFSYGNISFLSILGSLWDRDEAIPYKVRLKTAKSLEIPNPTISILAGNTPTGFATAFPPEVLGQGFFSRVLLIYGEPNGKKITFPRTPSEGERADIVSFLARIRENSPGRIDYTDTAETLLDSIYKRHRPIGDMRFDAYNQRRFVHLLKLCIIVAASRLQDKIDEVTVIEANTYLSYAETLMPKALGEFGKDRNSDVMHKILSFIENKFREEGEGSSIKELSILTSSDVGKATDLGDLLRKLSMSEKIQAVKTTGGTVFMPIKKGGLVEYESLVDLGYLTDEEKHVKG